MRHIADLTSVPYTGASAPCHTSTRSTPEGAILIPLAWVVLCLGTLAISGMPLAVWAQDASDLQRGADGTSMFDIRPQSLGTALRAYGELTGQTVLVDDSLTAGRFSPGVRGTYGNAEALQRLLAGTGLVASYSADQAFTLKLATRADASDSTPDAPVDDTASGGMDVVTQSYAGSIQRSVEAALCRFDETRPGAYRLALQVWIAPSGRIEQTRVLSDADPARAAAVSDALQRVKLEPPPAAMPQPLTMLLLPRMAVDTGRCGAAARKHH